ncbi:carbon-nitrogen hydrolase [Metschnikowia bicuspidata var. bicuspidata NRRL YB-4993]|uniref:Carbon-nitrogen hydrolase n=1 Tax=Metschnikowia bicuspidata var. bicuspidata NRRL YB-4993 TaxID=869754 RepID=A0A1A0HFG0_9ASCO|nr:carbon-nitrogen hydrolase [Metschnikowia bicuspidata var. bicuspidata NRRL YB-4993]OBA22736.1 carbon-nitrogen hydrolase [Metschnikowia bicuspidata var. bicuspidata NRRL YB-4993]
MRLRIACLQLNPLLGKVEANVAKINRMMADCQKEIDLLVLPELAVTGYNFKLAKEIEPYLEKSGEGASFKIARLLSQKFKCTTVIGYPEKFGSFTYNSALVVDEKGYVVSNYRKSHLYETDEAWGCSENPVRGFPPFTLLLPDKTGAKGEKVGLVTANIGICMDMNPYQFKADFNEFEFSMNCWKNDASLIIVPTAWLSSDSPSIQEGLSEIEKANKAALYQDQIAANSLGNAGVPTQSLVDYWIVRLFPFLAHPYNGLPRKTKRTTVVICNRVGIEDQVLYGGSSSIMQFDPLKGESDALDASNPSVDVVASAGWASEEMIYHEVEI